MAQSGNTASNANAPGAEPRGFGEHTRGLAGVGAPGASLARSMMAQQDQADELYQHIRRGPYGQRSAVFILF